MDPIRNLNELSRLQQIGRRAFPFPDYDLAPSGYLIERIEALEAEVAKLKGKPSSAAPRQPSPAPPPAPPPALQAPPAPQNIAAPQAPPVAPPAATTTPPPANPVVVLVRQRYPDAVNMGEIMKTLGLSLPQGLAFQRLALETGEAMLTPQGLRANPAAIPSPPEPFVHAA